MKIDFPNPTTFLETKPHSRFIEFAESCIEHRYIGVCYGRPGVGKTRSAQEFTQWPDRFDYNIMEDLTPKIKSEIAKVQGIFTTATVSNTPKILDQQLTIKLYFFGHARLRTSGNYDDDFILQHAYKAVPLVVVDEADRLSLKSLEHLRHLYDKYGMGLILMGMPGIEKRLARYPQLYSRIGFLHEFKPLSDIEMRFLFAKRSESFGLIFDQEKFEHAEAMAIIIRLTRGNFRLMERLFAQMKRIMAVNNMNEVSGDVVEAARDCLVIGTAE